MKLLLLIITLSVTSLSTFAQHAGTLDVSFGGTGNVSTPFAHSPQEEKLLIQPNGKIIVAGSYNVYTPPSGDIVPFPSSDLTYFVFARYNQNGTLDNTFGINGIATFNVYNTEQSFGWLEGIALQADGNIIGVGRIPFSGGIVIRLNSNGTLDNTFDGDGIKNISSISGIGIESLISAKIQSNGKIIMVGKARITNNDTDFAIIRLNTDGSLDLGFDGDGLQTTHFTSNDRAYSVDLQIDGKIVVVGMDDDDILIARYTSSGVLDTSFDGDGKQILNYTPFNVYPTVKIQADSKILIGYSGNSMNGIKFYMTRLKPNGSLDVSFDVDGTVSAFTNNGYLDDFVIQADGKIIASGGFGTDFIVHRYNVDGSLDISFNGTGIFNQNARKATKVALQNDGKIVVASWSNSNHFYLTRLHGVSNFNSNNGKVYSTFGISTDVANAVAIRSNGKIVSAGYSLNAVSATSNNDFAIVQHNADGSLDNTFGSNSKVNTDIGASTIDEIKALLLLPDGKIIAAGNTGIGLGSNFAIVKYLADGSGLDLSFGTGGKTTVDFSASEDIVFCTELQADSKILVAGNTTIGTNTVISVIRLNSNGTLDATFGTGGKFNTNISIPGYASTRGIAIQRDGKIVLAVYANGNFNVVRLNINGSLDVTFDGDGKRTESYSTSGFEEVQSIALTSDGKILIGGSTDINGTDDYAIMKFNTDGSLDGSFGTGGKMLIDVNSNSSDLSSEMTIYPSGKIMIAGNANFQTMGLCRVNPNGTLDATFDGDGKMNFEFGYQIDRINAMKLQEDGKVLLAGDYFNGTNNDFILMRINSVSDFSTNNGKMINPISLFDNEAYSMTEQPDGKIILGGYASNAPANVNGFNNSSFVLERHNADGSLDNTFDGDGIVKTFFNDFDDFCTAIAIQADGKIVAVGHTYKSDFDSDFALVRYNTNGSLDNTFGTNGKVTTSVSASNDFASSVLIQADGKIVIGGSSVNSSNKFSLFRYNANGTPDNTFGTNGSVVSVFGTINSISKIAIQADGKIVAAGFVRNGTNYDFALARYTTAGVLDLSFNTTGILSYDFGSNSDFGRSVLIQSDGKILVGGEISNGANTDFAFVRLNADGTFDNTFDSDGKLTLPIGTGNDNLKSIRVLANGKILATGNIFNGTDFDLGIVRLNSNGSIDNSFNSNGKFIKPIGYGNDFARAIVYQNGNYLIGGSYFNGSNYDFALTKVIPCDIETPILVNSADNYPNAALPNPQIGKYITASNLINNTSNVTYKAPKSIVLNPGFKADNGSVFKTEIITCTY